MENNFLQTLVNKTRERQIVGITTKQFAQQKAGEVAAIRGESAREADIIRERVVERREKTEHGRVLGSSMNPIDRLKLNALKIFDAGNYDPQKRAQRTQEDVQYLQALGTIGDVKLQGIQAQLLEAQGQLDLAALSEQVALERAQEAGKLKAIRVEEMLADSQLRGLTLQNITKEQAQKYLSQKPDENGNINVNGVSMTPMHLNKLIDDRDKEAIARRTLDMQFDMLSMQYGKTKEEMKLWEDNRFARELNIKTQANVAQEEYYRSTRAGERRDSELKDNAFKAESQEREKLKWIEQDKMRVLESMSQEALEAVKRNDYVDSEGIRYNPNMVDAQYDAIKQREAEEITRQYDQQTATSVPGIVSQSAQETQLRMQSFAPGTPMHTALKNQQVSIGQAQSLLDSAIDPRTGAVNPLVARYALERIQQGQKTFLAEVQKQAKIESGGDKDHQAFLENYYATGKANPVQFSELLTKRLLNGQTVGGLLSPEDAIKLEGMFSEERNTIRNSSDLISGRPRESDIKALEQTAATQAVARLARDNALGLHRKSISDAVNFRGAADPTRGMNVPAHPLHGKMTQGEYENLIHQSENFATTMLADEYGISTQKLATALIRGTDLELGEGGEVVPYEALIEQANQVAQMNLNERLGRDVADSIVDWNANYGNAYIENFVQRYAPNQQGANAAAKFELSMGMVEELFNEQAIGFAMANQSQADRQVGQMLSFSAGKNPEEFQAVLLAVNPHTTMAEKAMLWDKFAPIIETAKSRGLEGDAAHAFIESGLTNIELESPAEKKAMKNFMRDRDTDMQKMQDMLSGVLFMKTGLSQSGNLNNREGQLRQVPMWGTAASALSRSANNLDFYKNWKASR